MTSCLGAKRRQKRWGKGDGKWVDSMYTQANLHKYFTGQCRNEWDGKLALAQDGTPSRSEPGEPRRFDTYQRTPSPKLGGKDDKMKGNSSRRERNYKRGVRNEATVEIIIIETKTEGPTEEFTQRNQKRPPGETGGGWPPKPDESQHNPSNRRINAITKNNINAPNKFIKTRTSIIRGLSRTQKIPDKDKEPDTNKMKWKYGETVKVASINVRGMGDPVKREEIRNHTHGNEWN